jgi:hypothetical protein
MDAVRPDGLAESVRACNAGMERSARHGDPREVVRLATERRRLLEAARPPGSPGERHRSLLEESLVSSTRCLQALDERLDHLRGRIENAVRRRARVRGCAGTADPPTGRVVRDVG